MKFETFKNVLFCILKNIIFWANFTKIAICFNLTVEEFIFIKFIKVFYNDYYLLLMKLILEKEVFVMVTLLFELISIKL